MLVKYPKSSPLLVVVAILGGLVVAALIVTAVFIFAYYGSGMAFRDAQERARQEAPIDVEFGDPNG